MSNCHAFLVDFRDKVTIREIGEFDDQAQALKVAREETKGVRGVKYFVTVSQKIYGCRRPLIIPGPLLDLSVPVWKEGKLIPLGDLLVTLGFSLHDLGGVHQSEFETLEDDLVDLRAVIEDENVDGAD